MNNLVLKKGFMSYKLKTHNKPSARTSRKRAARFKGVICMTDFENNASNGAAESELHRAAWSGDLEWVKEVVEGGADINWKDSSGETAIFGACGWGRNKVVKYLIDKKALINIKEETGLTPLHWAAKSGGLETVKLLIEAGADTSIANKFGQLPIDLAHEAGKGDRVAYLKTVGPKIKSRREK